MRKLIITRTWVIREGQGQKGPWTLSGVEATDEQGNAIPYEMKTFAKLPNGPVEVDVERQEHEQYGVSFLLKPIGGNGRGAAAGAADVAELRGRIERLESEVRRISAVVDRRDPDLPVAPPPVSSPAYAGLPNEDDIPF